MKFNLSELVGWLIPVAFGSALLLACYYFITREQLIAASAGDGNAATRRRFGEARPLLRIFAPLIVVLGEIISTLPIDAARKKLSIKLTQAGLPGALNADEFNATRILMIAFFSMAGMFIDTQLDSWPMVTMILGFLGVVYPSIWLSGYIAKRRRRIFRDLPDTLDTLRLAVDAGLDFGSAMGVVVEKGRRGPLLDELEKVERDMALGRTRQEALRGFADRIAMAEINAFVLALIQADQLGSSIGPILKVQADVARQRRWQVAETIVNKLPMKMLGPLIVFIFPASFIILFTPLLIQYMQGEG